MAANRKPTGHFWTPPASLRVNKPLWNRHTYHENLYFGHFHCFLWFNTYLSDVSQERLKLISDIKSSSYQRESNVIWSFSVFLQTGKNKEWRLTAAKGISKRIELGAWQKYYKHWKGAAHHSNLGRLNMGWFLAG